MYLKQEEPMPHYNVLFLCTGNSARSIMAEAILNRRGAPSFTAYSAGSHPSGIVRPEALRQLESAGLSTDGLYSKSWDEFAKSNAPVMNFVFTVCDNAANEQCPYWPGQPMTAHWGVPDPAAVVGTPEGISQGHFVMVFGCWIDALGCFSHCPSEVFSRWQFGRKLKR
jgi:arsenate reductase (thioredoxin)